MFSQLFYRFHPAHRSMFHRIQSLTGLSPKRLAIYYQVFIPRSTEPSPEKNNERLELLGDSVLDMAVCELLYKKYPFKDEGFLTALKSRIVNRKQLNDIGHKLGLVEQLHINRRVLHSGAKDLGGNTFEALIGAVFLDHGYEATRRFIHRHIIRQYVDVEEMQFMDTDYKSRMYQYAQREGIQIGFKLKAEEIRNRRSYFTIELCLNDEPLASGEAFNKKEAEQLASMRAVQKLTGQGISLPG